MPGWCSFALDFVTGVKAYDFFYNKRAKEGRGKAGGVVIGALLKKRPYQS